MEGTISLFGYPSTEARLDVLPRSAGWRILRAGAFFTAGLGLAPTLGLVPPHAPWALLALGVGGFLGIRKWRERYTILRLEGTCPKCLGGLSIRTGTPLRPNMTLPCPGCNHDTRLTTAIPENQAGTREES